MNYDAIVIGAGLAGLVAAAEIADAGKRVAVVDQEGPQNLGGQAFWSFGGLFFVDSPEQRRMRIHDSHALAHSDWLGTAGFDRPEDYWPRKWADAYVDFATHEKRSWLHAQGMRFFPVVGWAERGGYGSIGAGNSVPRFHIVWGTGPGVLAPFVRRTQAARARGSLDFFFRHRVDDLIVEGGAPCGVRGAKLAVDGVPRGAPSSRDVVGEFELRAGAVVVASGGIGGNHELVRRNWPARMGAPPKTMIQGVPDHVDGRMLGITERHGARLINRDRMWHYTEGLRNWAPIWRRHGIRILPGPSSLWLDATGKRLPVPLFPGFDTLGTLEYIMTTGHDYTWFVTDQSIVKREFALSGSEQNPDLTDKDVRAVLSRAIGKSATRPVEAFKEHGADFVVRNDLDSLLAGMRAVAGDGVLDVARVREEILARDAELSNPYGKDMQLAAIRQARNYLGDRLIRAAKPHRLLDPAHGPLIAVKLNILTRKTLGGFETDLEARVFGSDGERIPGLYAVGEAAGFGGGGVHGYRSLEGTFLGGCIFSGRAAGRSIAANV
jgi:predicted oxidoreductase